MLDHFRQFRPSAEFSAILPMKALPRFTGADLAGVVSELLRGTGAAVAIEPNLTIEGEGSQNARFWNRMSSPPRVGLIIDDVTIVAEGHDRAAFAAEALDRLDTRLWADGRARVERACAHVAISEIQARQGGGLDRNYDRAAIVTVVAAAVARLVETVGIVWCASGCALPSERLPAIVAAMIKGSAPISLWLGQPDSMSGSGRGKFVSTRGFFPLLGAEIEVVAPEMTASDAFDLALEVATEIVRSGEAPAQGDRLQFTDDEAFCARWRAKDGSAGGGGAVPTLVLTRIVDSAGDQILAGAA